MDLTQRCSVLSRSDEPLAGSAPEAVRWLLVQDPGPWGRDGLADGHLPTGVRRHLADQLATHDVRHQALRRVDRSRPVRRAVFMANLAAGWFARTDLPAEDLVDLDLSVLHADAPPPGFHHVVDPLVAVCTHAKRDACCALWGRPIAAALAARAPDAVWETSHTSGHRFAASVLTFPHGGVYGRVEDPDILFDAIEAGRVDLSTYRGNAALSQPAQAAEVAIRVNGGHDAPDDVKVISCEVVDDQAVVMVAAGDDLWQVSLVQRGLPDRPVSCGADPKPLRVWVVEGVRAMASD